MAVLALALAAAPARAASVTSQFTYTGGEQTFVVPDGVHSIHVTAQGAPGGSGTPLPSHAEGQLIFADVPVTPGETLYVEVGGRGSDLCCVASFNGGAPGGADTIGANDGGGGGGASDVRRLPRTAPGSESSRMVVAGGGGGGGGGGSVAGPTGASRFQPAGSCAQCGGAGADGDTAGGSGGAALGVDAADGADGAIGAGGEGGEGTVGGGGGGGGGYYGGGGGGGGDTASPDGGGGGGGLGSSFAVAGSTLAGRFTLAPLSGDPVVRITYQPGTPSAEVTPRAIAFGRQPLASTSARVVTIKNTGSATLRLVSAKILSSRSTDFAFGTSCTAPLAVGASCQLPVRFTPHRATTQRVHAQIETNGGPRFVSLTFTGTGIHARRKLSALRISPSTFTPARRGSSTARNGPVVVSYRADSAGKTTFRVLRVKGRRLIPVGASFAHADRRGTNRLHLTGRVKRGGETLRLTPGLYKLRASPRGKLVTGRPRTVAFRVIRAR